MGMLLDMISWMRLLRIMVGLFISNQKIEDLTPNPLDMEDRIDTSGKFVNALEESLTTGAIVPELLEQQNIFKSKEGNDNIEIAFLISKFLELRDGGPFAPNMNEETETVEFLQELERETDGTLIHQYFQRALKFLAS